MARGVAKKGEVERKKGPFDILKNASQQCNSDGDGTRGKGKQKGESSSDQDCPLLDRLLSERDDRIARPNGEE